MSSFSSIQIFPPQNPDLVRTSEVTSTADLTLRCASGSAIACSEGSTQLCRISDESGTRVLSFSGAGATVTAAGDLTLQSTSGHPVIVSEGSTAVLNIEDAAGVSKIAGQGSTATELAATNGPVRLRGTQLELFDGS